MHFCHNTPNITKMWDGQCPIIMILSVHEKSSNSFFSRSFEKVRKGFCQEKLEISQHCIVSIFIFSALLWYALAKSSILFAGTFGAVTPIMEFPCWSYRWKIRISYGTNATVFGELDPTWKHCKSCMYFLVWSDEVLEFVENNGVWSKFQRIN